MTYAATGRTEPQIAARIWAALGDGHRHDDTGLTAEHCGAPGWSPMISGRDLGLAGLPNARDLGGHHTSTGPTVRPGILFRADAPANAVDTDLVILRRLEVVQVIDLRGETEIAAFGIGAWDAPRIHIPLADTVDAFVRDGLHLDVEQLHHNLLTRVTASATTDRGTSQIRLPSRARQPGRVAGECARPAMMRRSAGARARKDPRMVMTR
jgi:hypothetical protein